MRLKEALPFVFSTIALAAEPVDLGHGYTRNRDVILFDGQPIEETGRDDLPKLSRSIGKRLTLCHDVDAASFVALSEEYSKDRNTVYYKWVSPGRFWVIELPEADPASFEVLGFNLARDEERVWWYGAAQEGVDPATLELVNEGFVWKDARAVYYQHEKLEGADPASFERLNQHFYRDTERVYWCNTPLPEADPASFRTFGPDLNWGADDKEVWRCATRIEGIDAASFQPVHQSVVKDRRAVYISPLPTVLAGADPATFRKIADLDIHFTALFKDSRRAYIYLPLRGEVYQLELRPNSLHISRTLWYAAPGKKPHSIGHSTADLTAAGWQNRKVVTVEKPPYQGIPAIEAHLQDTYTRHFQDAWEILRKLPEEQR